MEHDNDNDDRGKRRTAPSGHIWIDPGSIPGGSSPSQLWLDPWHLRFRWIIQVQFGRCSKHNVPPLQRRGTYCCLFPATQRPHKHTVLTVFILTNLVQKILFYNKFIICLYMFRALCVHHQEVLHCIIQHLVSSHLQLAVPCTESSLCTGRPPTDVMIPDAV